MSYTAFIRDNISGEVRESFHDLEWHGDGSLYWWTEGNMGCDCNRGLIFHDHADDSDDYPCGGMRYSVLKLVFPDGREILIDS